MKPPPGLPNIPGLKQTPRTLFEMFSPIIQLLAFRCSDNDFNIFVRHTSNGCIVIFIIRQ